MKKTIVMGLALAAVMAVSPMTAFAEDVTTIKNGDDGKPVPATGDLTVTYNVTAKYTVTIPVGVTLSDTEEQTETISATDVKLESGQKIKVKLTSATNTANGESNFNAKNAEKTSTANYTITGSNGLVKVGDTVATFSTSTDKQEQKLTFSKASNATKSGLHTETLTFTISTD